MDIGIVGLGRMGGAFCTRLAERGHHVVGYDVDPRARDLVETSPNIEVTKTLTDLFRAGCPLLLSLPDRTIVLDVIQQISPATWRMRPDAGIVDTSTIGVAGAEDVARTLREKGVRYAEAPVSGGVSGAHSGNLVLMTSGDESLLDAVNPVLRDLGRIINVGAAPGLGQMAKVLNNLVSATNLAIVSEVVAAAGRSGLDAQTLINVLNSGSGRNSATQDKFPTQVLTGHYNQGFQLRLMAKDISLAQDLMHTTDVPAWVSAAVFESWRAASREMPNDCDFTEIARFYGVE